MGRKNKRKLSFEKGQTLDKYFCTPKNIHRRENISTSQVSSDIQEDVAADDPGHQTVQTSASAADYPGHQIVQTSASAADDRGQQTVQTSASAADDRGRQTVQTSASAADDPGHQTVQTSASAADDRGHQTVQTSTSAADYPGHQTVQTSASATEVLAYDVDIGAILKVHPRPYTSIDDFTKHKILTSHWVPPPQFSFPYSEHLKSRSGKKEKRYASRKHLETFKKWLVLSKSERGYFCKVCPLFVVNLTGGVQKTVPLLNLVTKPLTSFSKLTGKDGYLTVHEENKYHKLAMEASRNFLATFNNPSTEITSQLSTQHQQQVDDNRKVLGSIVETVRLCGRQNIALRGHRDDGEIKDDINQGNMRALLRFRIDAGDKMLEHHLKTALSQSGRNSYISKTVQNEIIACFSEEIQSVILGRVHAAEVYSIVFDETTDISHISQMAFAFRYIHEKEVREDFFKFIDLFSSMAETNQDTEVDRVEELRASGKAIAQEVIKILETAGLTKNSCIGVGTDGCTVMTSNTRGAVHEVKKILCNAVHCPCYNHKLNLSISNSSSIPSIRNAVGSMKEVVSFFTSSAKRNTVLKKVLGSQLINLSETRWVERHDSVIQFRENLTKIVQALDEISTWNDPKTASKAKILSSAVCESEFIVSIVSLANVLAKTHALSRYLQKKTIDVVSAKQTVHDVIAVLKKARAEVEERFSQVFQEVEELSEILGVQVTMPRVVKKQRHRANLPAIDAIEYFRINVFVPLLDHVITDLKNRFSDGSIEIFYLQVLVPQILVDKSQEAVQEAVDALSKKYHMLAGNNDIGPFSRCLKAEIELWQQKWSGIDASELPNDAISAFRNCDGYVYPNIHLLLRVLVTLPISVATAERSFSGLRRLKTWLRSIMSEDRLVGLALLHVHQDIHIPTEKIIERFSKQKNRRLKLVL